jgi:hypothetical protein
MANQVPLSGATDAAGGVLLPDEQGALLADAIQREAGALSLAGDSRTTSSRREVFPIWKGRPTAEFVGEGGTKPVTGAEFGAGTLNIKKIATIITFTDEMLEDVQNGDLNVLVDSDIRGAIADTADSDAVKGSVFDSQLVDTTQVVAYDSNKQDAFALAVSAAMGSLEANGYTDFGVLVPADFPRHLRDARVTGIAGGTADPVQSATSQGLYQPVSPLYGAASAVSTNLNTIAAGGTIAYVVSRPNLHVRIRRDVTVLPSREATVGGTSLYQLDLTAARYVTRLGLWIHDINRAVVKITK